MRRGGDQNGTVRAAGAGDVGLDVAEGETAATLPGTVAGLNGTGAKLEIAG
jgi:hypothetical protein